MDSEQNTDNITFFAGHVDKPFVHVAWFVPLGLHSFSTVLSVPNNRDSVQDPNSKLRFDEWKDVLSASDSKKVNEFLQEFDRQAKRYMRQESLVRLIYLNSCGSVLSFPANLFFHATITPKKYHGYPRDLFIFHPLDGIA